MKIALIPNADKPLATKCALSVLNLLTNGGAQVLLPSHIAENIETHSDNIIFCDTYDKLFCECDSAVTVGGDGTIIHSARFAAKYGKPILGINTGRLGYVAELEAGETDLLLKLLSGEFKICNRMILDISVIHSDGNCETFLAINDAVISRGSLSQIIDLDVYEQEEKICTYRADGLLFSTPIGSTAYALSAGGPVIDPGLDLIELTPVCPHSLTQRTVIFNPDAVLSVKCKTPDSSYLTIDGQISVKLSDSDTVRISKSSHPLKMSVLKSRNFYKTAGEKLTQSEDAGD